MQVTIYATTICAGCHALEQWLSKVGQPYTKKITDADPAAMAEFMTVNDGMIGVPFTVVTTDDGMQAKVVGFDQPALKRALNLA